jgi:hypothetical protein
LSKKRPKKEWGVRNHDSQSPTRLRRKASLKHEGLRTGNFSKEYPTLPVRESESDILLRSHKKLQSQYIRSQLLVSQKIIADPEVMPDPKPRLFLLDGKFVDLARGSSVADALTVRALMIKGVSRVHIAKSGLSLKANKVNWDLLETDRHVPSVTTYLEGNKHHLTLFEQDLTQKRIAMRVRSQVALNVRLRPVTTLELLESPNLIGPVATRNHDG